MSGPLSQLSAAGRAKLKVLTARLIRAAGGPENAEPVTRVKRPALSKYQSKEHPDHFMPLDVAAELTLDTVEQVGPLIAQHFADLSGHAVVELPEAEAADPHLAFALAARRTGETVARFAECLSDGHLEADEVIDHDLIDQIDRSVRKLLALKAIAQALVDNECGAGPD